MTVRRIKFLLWAISAIFVAGAWFVLSLACNRWDMLMIVQIPKSSPVQAGEARVIELPSLDALQAVCQRDLRQPLYDTPPSPKPVPLVAPPAKPSPPFSLAGTVYEHDHSRAMLVGPDGNVQFKKIGDVTQGVQVMDIARDSVTLKYEGREVILKVAKKN